MKVPQICRRIRESDLVRQIKVWNRNAYLGPLKLFDGFLLVT